MSNVWLQSDLTKIVAQGQQDANRALISREDFALSRDINKDGINDEFADAEKQRQHDKQMQEDNQKHEKELKNMELKSKEKIERMKPKPTTGTKT